MRQCRRWRTRVARFRLSIVLLLAVVVEVILLFKTRAVSTIGGDASFLHGFVPEKDKDDDDNDDDGDMTAVAACLLVRDDNALIPEWIAYHYTVLPLRDLVIAADLGSTEDIQWVSQRWSSLMRVSVWNHTHFLPPRFQEQIDSKKETDNHQYLHRQRAFLTSCLEFFKRQSNTSWVALVDTDEYITLNRDCANYTTGQEDDETATSATTTVLQAFQRHPPTSPCHGMPRLLFGALDNVTCNESEHVRNNNNNVLQQHSFPPLTTIRFVQHAPKGAFYPSKWGKVLVNVQDVSWESLQHHTPKSSHRPLKECPKPLFDWHSSPVVVNHYLGSWERYSRRNDSRRSREAFDERASWNHGNNCNTQIHEWIPDFVQQVELERARELLRLQDE